MQVAWEILSRARFLSFLGCDTQEDSLACFHLDFVKKFWFFFFYSYCAFSKLLKILLSAVGKNSIKNLEVRIKVWWWLESEKNCIKLKGLVLCLLPLNKKQIQNRLENLKFIKHFFTYFYLQFLIRVVWVPQIRRHELTWKIL